MRKILTTLLIVLTLVGTSFAADYNPDVNYIAMINGVLTECGDDGIGAAAILEQKRNQKILDAGLAFDCTSFCTENDSAADILSAFNAYVLRNCKNYTIDDQILLAKVITMEAGSSWLSDEWKFAVGEVVMNRVFSSEWPDTIYEVVHQPGQYDRTWHYDGLSPDAVSLNIAKRLLEGERHMPASIVFQAGFPQGSGVYQKFYDSCYGYTYFCYSNQMSLYK